jgi:hypothetical protein
VNSCLEKKGLTKVNSIIEELDGPVVNTLRRAFAEVKQHWSVIGWVSKNLLSRAPPCFGRYVKPLVSAAFAVVSTPPTRSTYVQSIRKAYAPGVGTLIGG